MHHSCNHSRRFLDSSTGRFILVLLGVLGVPALSPIKAAEPTRAEAERALRKAVGFFRSEVSIDGGYLWRYSSDLKQQEGEGKGSPTTAWVQPPGTPSIGDVYLRALDRTGGTFYRDAAIETARALVKGQLRSGGWDYRIEFHPRQRTRYAYRIDPARPQARNETTLDDNTTQSAISFLIRVDRLLEFQDAGIHEAAEFALRSLLKAQYPNGAWPQRYFEFPDPTKHPVKKASYPKSWSRTRLKVRYRDFYTFNDNSIAHTVALLFEAAEIYGKNEYRQAAEKAGGFILLAQMPEPQPGWAQQYDLDMQPAWARRFEPPSITGGESQGVLRTLMLLYRKTGDRRYLEPIPRALAYYKKSELPDGRVARFYELKTNRPLYFTKDYQLTYSSDDMPTHYRFIVDSRFGRIEDEYDRLLKTRRDELNPAPSRPRYRLTKSLSNRTRRIIDSLDERGAWVEPGRLSRFGDASANEVIDCRTFIRNVDMLSQFVAAASFNGKP